MTNGRFRRGPDPSRVITSALLKAALLDNQPMEGARLRARIRDLAYFRIKGNPAVLEDVTQIVLVKITACLLSGDEPRTPHAWVKTIVKNCTLDAYRQHRALWSSDDLNVDEVESIDDRVIDHDVLASGLLEEAIESLDEKYQQVIILRYLDEMRPGRIANLMGVSVNTVLSRIQRAKQQIRDYVRARRCA